MTNDLFIREATLADAAAIAALLTELNETVGIVGLPEPDCYAPENTRVTAAQMAARMSRARDVETLFVAEAGGQPAGFTSLRLIPYLDQDTPYAEVTQMYVRPEFRRQGAGVALIAAAEARARSAGATCVHVLTGLDNVRARSFYAAAGYQEICMELEKWFEAAG